MTLDLLFGKDQNKHAQYLMQIDSRLTEARANLLSQVIGALEPAQGNPLELMAWTSATCNLIATCTDQQLITALEIAQDHLRTLIKEATCSQDS